MSKKRPSKAEARWRANYRYRRMRAMWIDEAAIGDPLGLAAIVRRDGTMAAISRAILATARAPGKISLRPDEMETAFQPK
jgi:2-hydroxychromene-2-carboxylate isomerase